MTRDKQLRNFFGFIVHSCPDEGWKMLDDFLGTRNSICHGASSCKVDGCWLARFEQACWRWRDGLAVATGSSLVMVRRIFGPTLVSIVVGEHSTVSPTCEEIRDSFVAPSILPCPCGKIEDSSTSCLLASLAPSSPWSRKARWG